MSVWKHEAGQSLSTLQVGTPPDYTEFEIDGTMKANGAATTFDDIPPIPLLVQRVGGGNTPSLTTFIGDIQLLTFAINDYVYFNYEFLHSYKEGSSASLHIHWATNGLEGVNKYVKWEVEYSISNAKAAAPFDGVFPVSSILTVETIIPANTSDKAHIISSFGLISIPTIKIGAYIVGRIRRIAASSTAPAANPFGITFGLHIESDTLGSRQLYTK